MVNGQSMGKSSILFWKAPTFLGLDVGRVIKALAKNGTPLGPGIICLSFRLLILTALGKPQHSVNSPHHRWLIIHFFAF